MAKFLKTRARAALAEGQLQLAHSWSPSTNPDGSFDLSVRADETAGGDARYFKLGLSSKEAVDFAVFVARLKSCGDAASWLDKRTAAQALRDFADKLEMERG